MISRDAVCAVFGAGEFGRKLNIEMKEQGYNVTFFVDNNSSAQDVSTISPLELKWRIDRGEVDAVVIAVKDYYSLGDIAFQLHEIGALCSIYVCSPDVWNLELLGAREIEELIYPLDISYKSFITKLEYHVCDHCNLNCKGCSHFAPIYKESYADIATFKKDVQQLTRIFDNIFRFRLMGGEPFLNSQLDEFISVVREGFPHSHIEIVTNGLCLEKVDERIWETVREANAVLNISLYPPTYKIADKISSFLNGMNVVFSMGSGLIQHNDSGIIEEFHKNFTRNNNHSPWIASSRCMGNRCHYLRNGKISKCALPLLANDINNSLGTDYILTKDDYVDIYEQISPWDMIRKLHYATPFCAYCSDKGTSRFLWARTKQEDQSISDYVIDERD